MRGYHPSTAYLGYAEALASPKSATPAKSHSISSNLRDGLGLLAKLNENNFFAKISEWGVDRNNNSNNGVERATSSIKSGHLRFTQWVQTQEGGLLLLSTFTASLRDLNRFCLLHFDVNGEVTMHFCTCRYGNTSSNSIPALATKLHEYLGQLKRSESRVDAPLPPHLSNLSVIELKVSLHAHSSESLQGTES